jgi:hypothetical protein
MITNGTVRNLGEPDYSHIRVIYKQPENGRMYEKIVW